MSATTAVLVLIGIFALAAFLLAVPRLFAGRGEPPDDDHAPRGPGNGS
jgi:hypothetical protein